MQILLFISINLATPGGVVVVVIMPFACLPSPKKSKLLPAGPFRLLLLKKSRKKRLIFDSNDRLTATTIAAASVCLDCVFRGGSPNPRKILGCSPRPRRYGLVFGLEDDGGDKPNPKPTDQPTCESTRLTGSCAEN